MKTLKIRIKDKHAAVLSTVRMEPAKYCLYQHSSDGVVFYVGVGVSTRPFERIKRNALWDAFVAAAGAFDVMILQWSDNRLELLRAEAAAIGEHKPACNQMMNGYTHSEERRAKTSATHKGKVISEETRQRMSAASKARPNGWDGRSHSSEAVEKIRAAQTSYPVRCVETGLEFDSLCDAARTLAISKTSLRAHLGGRAKHVRGMTFERLNIRARGLASLEAGAGA